MEHSLLHALQLSGAVVALGGAILMLAFVYPALKASSGEPAQISFVAQLEARVARSILICGALAIGAAGLNFIVDTAEIDSRTIFGGFKPELIWRLATGTTVGLLSLLRLAALTATTAATRLANRVKWWSILAGAFTAVLCEAFICHAAAQPTARATAITSEMIHVVAASLWIGVLINLLLARQVLLTATENGPLALLAHIIRRFSPVAMTCVGLLVVSGLILTIRYLCTPMAVPTSAYGLTLLVKFVLLIPLLYAGYFNYRTVTPSLQSLSRSGTPESRIALLGRFGRTLELEVTGGVLVLTLAGILASVSPPEQWGTLRLTTPQIKALATPHLPRTAIANPASFYGAQERTVADLYYSEFTHNWSGVMVLLLGCCWWLAQNLEGAAGRAAAKAWPLILIPFPFFIAVAADPEVWLLRKVSLAQTIQDPQLLEHQLGALMAFTLVGLGWWDQRRPAELRPLGYLLPVLMIVGSLMLLGHAHSTFSNTQELTNMINVQHAVFGSFGLFAGVIRWLNLRRLLPDRTARLLWPLLVIGLGLYMAFGYREAV
jgi:putative copper export protein